jgi:hypothetical protein
MAIILGYGLGIRPNFFFAITFAEDGGQLPSSFRLLDPVFFLLVFS